MMEIKDLQAKESISFTVQPHAVRFSHFHFNYQVFMKRDMIKNGIIFLKFTVINFDDYKENIDRKAQLLAIVSGSGIMNSQRLSYVKHNKTFIRHNANYDVSPSIVLLSNLKHYNQFQEQIANILYQPIFYITIIDKKIRAQSPFITVKKSRPPPQPFVGFNSLRKLHEISETNLSAILYVILFKG